MGNEERTDREMFFSAVLYLDRVENILTELGSTRQAMSVGPPLGDLQELKGEVCQRGRDYGIVGTSKTDIEIRQEAREMFESEVSG